MFCRWFTPRMDLSQGKSKTHVVSGTRCAHDRRFVHSSQTALTMTPQRILLFEQTISSRSYLIHPSACQLLDPLRYAAAAALLAVITRTHLFISSSRQTDRNTLYPVFRESERDWEGGSHQTMSGRAHWARNPDGRHSRARTWPCGGWLEKTGTTVHQGIRDVCWSDFNWPAGTHVMSSCANQELGGCLERWMGCHFLFDKIIHNY